MPVHRILQSFLAILSGRGLTIAAQLIGVPIFLLSWGPELYGEWLLITAIPSYLALSDFGLVQASSNGMVMKFAVGDRASASRILQASKWLVSMAAILLVAMLCAAMMLLPIHGWLGLSGIAPESAVAIVLLLGIKVALLQRATLVAAVSTAEGRNAAGIMSLNYIRLAGFVAVFAMVALGYSPLIAALGDCAATAIAYGVSQRLATLRYPWCRGGHESRWTFADLDALWRPALGFLAYPFSQALLTQGTVLVIGSALGASAVALYTTIRILTNSCLRLLEIGTNSIWPEISSSYARGDISRTRHWNRIGSQWVFWSSLLMFGALFATGRWLYEYWVGGTIKWNPDFFVLMAIAAFLESLQTFAKVLPLSTNQHTGLSWQIAALAFAYVALLIPIVGSWGLAGAAVTLGLHNLMLAVVMLSAARRLLVLPMLEYLRDITGTGAVMASLVTLSQKSARSDG